MSVVTIRPNKGFEVDENIAKMFYNWFHSAYPEWQINQFCTNEEARTMQDLEEFILKTEKIKNA